MFMLRGSTLACALLALLLACGCGSAFHRMPLRAVLWDDPDRRPFSPRPSVRYVSYRFDAADNAVLRPLATVWTFPVAHEAMNVNALDEVPSSSWFENRIGRFAMTQREVARGACDAIEPDAPFPWTVVGGKTYGSNPGFTIEDARGVRYLVKTDGRLQPERATAADAIAAVVFHAAGYFVPCNRVMFVHRDQLRIAPDATAELLGGARIPLGDREIDAVLRAATQLPDGRFRVALSRFVEGDPLGPFSYEGTRPDDPNDVVPHEARRDLRGLYVLFAWVGHLDARQENSLSAWVPVNERSGYVRHYLIDFGDCFGVMHESDELSRRFEHDHYLSPTTVLVDYLTAGLLDRPWYHAELGRAGRTLGYYDAHLFRPDAWQPGYANVAFDAHTEHDSAWMARIIARFGSREVEAAVSVGRLSRSIVREALTRILLERRRLILARYLTRLSPLAWPEIQHAEETVGGIKGTVASVITELCLDDLAVQSGIRDRGKRRYEARIAVSEPARSMELRTRALPGGRVCVALPAGLRYVALDVVASSEGRERTLPARLHVYRAGGRYEVAALERLDREEAP